MTDKMYALSQTLYKLFQLSFYFWIYLLRGFFLYSMIPALSALFLTINYIIVGDEEESVKVKYRKYFHMYKQHRLPSFLFTSVMIFSYVILFYMNKIDNDISVIVTIVVLYLLFLTAVTLIYCVNYLVIKQLTFKEAFILGFVAVVKNIIRSLLLAFVIVLLYLAAYWNLVFFVFFGPFILSLASKFLVQTTIQPNVMNN
ncbi:hypothetical protein [Paraliobacillus sediminis]|uniref:hypothetical protein n=1 Tax=Paraliobacillus sediminis TaxID=1885916 RepID=UPI000E3CB5D3|nr:hypothetical protein [Paraliobacillus sediminis]